MKIEGDNMADKKTEEGNRLDRFVVTEDDLEITPPESDDSQDESKE